MKAKLTKRVIESIKLQDKPFEVFDEDLPGFILRVYPSGRMTYWARYRLLDGKQGRYRIGSTDVLSPVQARDLAKKALAGVTRGENPTARKREIRADTLEEFIDGAYRDNHLSRIRTCDSSIKRLKSCFKAFMGRKLSDPTIGHAIEVWRSQRMKGGVKRKTINRDVAALRTVFSKALKWKLIKVHPLAGMESLDEDDSETIVRYLDSEEELRLIEALDKREAKMRTGRENHNAWLQKRHLEEMPSLTKTPFADYLKVMVIVSLSTGLRRNELFSLEWRDIDLDRAMFVVRAKRAKSGKERHIPLNADALTALAGWKKQSEGEGLVFPGKYGDVFNNTKSSWKALLKAADIKTFRWHDMRHHFASKLVMAGVDLNTVRELLGHADLKMTLRYAHLAPQVKAEAVSKLSIASPGNIIAFPAKAETQ